MNKETGEVKNPCKGYCKLNEDGICGGCGRTDDERTNWIFLSNDEKASVTKVAIERLKSMPKFERN